MSNWQALERELEHARSLVPVRVSSRERGDLIMLGIGGFKVRKAPHCILDASV